MSELFNSAIPHLFLGYDKQEAIQVVDGSDSRLVPSSIGHLKV